MHSYCLRVGIIQVVVAFVLILVSLTNGAISSPAEDIVAIHNYYRRLIGRASRGKNRISISNMKKMYWDQTLAAEAKLLVRCSNIDSQLGLPSEDLDLDELAPPKRGFNFATSHNKTLKGMVRQWLNERRFFDMEYQMCYSEGRCDRFMQLVSANTDRVGCALNNNCLVDGQSTQFLACVYSPGTDEASAIFKVGKTCTNCVEPTSFCDNGLCASCDKIHPFLCACRKTCGQYPFGGGKLDRYKCSCTCTYGMGPNCDEECKNPESYLDDDVCADVTEEECNDPDPMMRNMLMEFCPATCFCSKKPTFGIE